MPKQILSSSSCSFVSSCLRGKILSSSSNTWRRELRRLSRIFYHEGTKTRRNSKNEKSESAHHFAGICGDKSPFEMLLSRGLRNDQISIGVPVLARDCRGDVASADLLPATWRSAGRKPTVVCSSFDFSTPGSSSLSEETSMLNFIHSTPSMESTPTSVTFDLRMLGSQRPTFKCGIFGRLARGDRPGSARLSVRQWCRSIHRWSAIRAGQRRGPVAMNRVAPSSARRR